MDPLTRNTGRPDAADAGSHSGIGSPDLSVRLAVPTSPEWLEAVLGNFDAFLLDHAAAERKASAVAVSLITHYPDRKALVAAMMDVAREELEHFYQVYRRIEARGLALGGDFKDPYLGALRAAVRRGREGYFLDRLLLGAVVEARGRERFGILAEALPDANLRNFYRSIAVSEARHESIFTDLARTYFPADAVAARLAEWVGIEAGIVERLPIRAALH